MGKAIPTKFDLSQLHTATETIFERPDSVIETMTPKEIDEQVSTMPVSDLEWLETHGGDAAKGLDHYTPAMLERHQWISASIKALGTPPYEAELHLDERLCSIFPDRASLFPWLRHQAHLRCPECGNVARSIVTWSADRGFSEVPKHLCCGSFMLIFKETYVEKTPRPDAHDPEPERTWAWWQRISTGVRKEPVEA